MPEYRQIFTDSRTRTASTEQENFVRVTVYAGPDYRFPYLFNYEYGNNNNEGWGTEWSLYGHDIGDAGAIRQAITWLDNYRFKDSLSDPRD